MEFLIRIKKLGEFSRQLQISERTVRDALAGKSNTRKAIMIRTLAIEHGATVYLKVDPEVYFRHTKFNLALRLPKK